MEESGTGAWRRPPCPHGQVEHLDWTPDQSVESFTEALDAGLAEADALVAAPWFGFGGVVDFDAARLARAPRLKVIAGTFDYRLGWVDLDVATRRGVTVVDTSRTMTWTVAEFGVAITLALLRDRRVVPDGPERAANSPHRR